MVIIIKKGTPREEIKRRIAEAVSRPSRSNIRKYAGKLSKNVDPLDYQKQMRNEWE